MPSESVYEGPLRRPSLKMHLTDFANVLKAFIGSNYLTIAFAFCQSGLGLGIAGLLLVASLTAHCCHLLVKCKYYAINHILELHARPSLQHPKEHSSYDGYTNGNNSEPDRDEKYLMEEKLKHCLNFGDLGWLCFGKVGVAVVNAGIIMTQFGFCVGYCIFIGNTIFSMFPLYNCSEVVAENAILSPLISLERISDTREPVQSNNSTTLSPAQHVSFVNLSNLDVSKFLSSIFGRSTEKTSTWINNFSTSDILAAVLPSELPEPQRSELRRGDGVPDLRLLVLCPVFIFIILTLIRNVRQLGVISAIANIAIFVGCIEVLVFLTVDFELSTTYVWYNIRDMPIFLGLVTSSYEGIGTILPIEASMEGNRHNFAKFLYGAVALLTLILGGFGVLGYVRFGLDVQQMINANIPPGGALSLAVNTCLCVGVLLTFPLMMFPVVDLAEIYIFGNGRIFGPKHEHEKNITERQKLLPEHKELPIFISVTGKVSTQVSTWKRNVLRIIIVLMAGGLAVLLRNSFAYVSAFVGAVGSTVLAYILPCVFHLKLHWHHLPLLVKVKDIVIILVGFCVALPGSIVFFWTSSGMRVHEA
ncbi:hypothetical protein C0Q70_02198 [Pomacea canaliculata]|uniref:Amino acid transporter transmembrane domain-containing protein n=1 Tax=Pomacea canaliculata TaxID=400727 RepID=A0A2T7Q1M2_POMCA|nr:hypothetical protein C0Q70_02198 [Pomacea canaliculata]